LIYAGIAGYWLTTRTESSDNEPIQSFLSTNASRSDEAAQQSTRSIALVSQPVEVSPWSRTDPTLDTHIQDPNSASATPRPAPSNAGRKRTRGLSTAKAVHSGAVAQQRAASAPRRIDVVYQRMTSAQCARGVGGLFCREKLKFKLCKDRWTATHVPGMTICYLAPHAVPLS